jgi:hypothetical protein
VRLNPGLAIHALFYAIPCGLGGSAVLKAQFWKVSNTRLHPTRTAMSIQLTESPWIT